MATSLGNDTGEFVHLSLGTAHSAETLLSELTSTLILAVLDQFHNTLLIGSETDDLTDEGADELDALTACLKRKIRICFSGDMVRNSQLSSCRCC